MPNTVLLLQELLKVAEALPVVGQIEVGGYKIGWDQSHFFNNEGHIKDTDWCGTTACLAGFASFNSTLSEAGFERVEIAPNRWKLEKSYQFETVLGIDLEEMEDLFWSNFGDKLVAKPRLIEKIEALILKYSTIESLSHEHV